MKKEINVEEAITETAKLIFDSNRILFITGAGISADSGLPTYRGVGGLYNSDLTEDGIAIEDAISGAMMLKRPDITWKYLWQIGSACRKAAPNKAHEVISSIQTLKPDTWVLTQNIDGLHAAANTKNLIEIHGNSFSLHCTKCRREKDYNELILDFQDKIELPPLCSFCGGIIRPNVVLFGEMLPTDAITKFYELIDNNIDLVISIGTSGIFPYIVEPVRVSNSRNKPTVEINPTITDISYLFKYRIEMKAAGAMEKIWEKLRNL
jgi:NAD-dependent deacetylase